MNASHLRVYYGPQEETSKEKTAETTHEKVTVPLGTFDTVRIDAQSATISLAGTGASTRVKCIFWYSAQLQRAVKMHYVVDSPVFAAQTVETYELSSFQDGGK